MVINLNPSHNRPLQTAVLGYASILPLGQEIPAVCGHRSLAFAFPRCFASLAATSRVAHALVLRMVSCLWLVLLHGSWPMPRHRKQIEAGRCQAIATNDSSYTGYNEMSLSFSPTLRNTVAMTMTR